MPSGNREKRRGEIDEELHREPGGREDGQGMNKTERGSDEKESEKGRREG